jgi:hypothetical protein
VIIWGSALPWEYLCGGTKSARLNRPKSFHKLAGIY